MMVVPEPEDFAHHCHVDGVITISEVNVEVTRSGIWEPYSWNSIDNEKRRRLDDIVEKADENLFIWSAKLVNMEDQNSSLLFAGHMGSTSESHWDTAKREYWTATKGDLTPEGRALYEAVKGARGVEPLLITCLDIF